MLLFTVIIFGIFCSCSTNKITSDEVLNLDGIYNAKTLDNGLNYNFISLLNRELIRDTLREKPISDYKFELKKIDGKHIQIKVINENNKVVNSKTYKFKTKEKSIVLKNKNTKSFIVPYLAGVLDITKLDLKSDENRNLYVEVYKHRSGGVFLIPMGWSSTKTTENYERIK